MSKKWWEYIRNNKKGSFAVLAVMLFVSLSMVTVVFVNQSARLAEASYCDAVLQLAGRSVLSEYHTDLKNNYGLIAFKGYEQEVNQKLRFYLNESFNAKSGANNPSMIKPKLNRVSSRLDEYSLLDTDNFEKEIAEYALLSKAKKKEPKGKKESSSGKLVNQRIISELPSRYLQNDGFHFVSFFNIKAEKWSEIMKNTSDSLLADNYILNFCNCSQENAANTETFFQNEIEYILYGKLDDEENKEKFLNRFRIFRVGMNSLHITTDKKKMTALLAAAETITPGPEAEVTRDLLVLLWAEMEALNDKKLLLQGEGVELYKTEKDWAVRIDSVVDAFLENLTSDEADKGGAIKPAAKSDMKYKQYLQLFLACENRETKLVRLMDIIQINMQGSCDDSFKMKDMYTGVRYHADISGLEFEYVEKY